MSFNQPWAAKAAKRIGANIVVGALLTAIVGALCVATAGALLGWILDIRSTPPSWDSGFLGPGLFIGLFLGAWSGVLGALLGAVAACAARPGALFAPLAILKRVALGQLLGTLGALSSYLFYALIIAQTQNQSFVGSVEDNLILALIGVPITMNCGAIAGALWKRTNPTTALAVN